MKRSLNLTDQVNASIKLENLTNIDKQSHPETIQDGVICLFQNVISQEIQELFPFERTNIKMGEKTKAAND